MQENSASNPNHAPRPEAACCNATKFIVRPFFGKSIKFPASAFGGFSLMYPIHIRVESVGLPVDLHGILTQRIPAGKAYLSPVIDCFDGLVVSWSIGTRPDAELVNTMLDSAIESVADSDERPRVHSDRGAHYRWPGWAAARFAASDFGMLPVALPTKRLPISGAHFLNPGCKRPATRVARSPQGCSSTTVMAQIVIDGLLLFGRVPRRGTSIASS
jgi:hypothetical protein